uniref:Proline and serine rich 2 n=1 Tax=Myripristis murdjan TaxID=586833 RepID=A0A667YRU6_9TELE
MVVSPDSHFEIKPRRDPVDSLPLEYDAPLPVSSHGPPDSQFAYHPPGCIPTPVLIAQKIAENQASGPASVHPSILLRRRSLESDKPPSYSFDHPAKQGPPTSAKPTRFPSNISVMLGNKEHHNQSLANVNIQERRAQMLANLSGTSHPLEQVNCEQVLEQKTRNIPTPALEIKPFGQAPRHRATLPSSASPARTSKAPAPALAPKPIRRHHSSHSPQKVVARHQSPEPRRRSTSKQAAFRPQGITVQFSGRGATDESRREALRKLGLLKDTF